MPSFDAPSETNTATSADGGEAQKHDQITFPAGRPGQSTTTGHDLFPQRSPSYRRVSGRDLARKQEPMMGPILKRKKVVSLPLGAGGEFFYTTGEGPGPHQTLLQDYDAHHRARERRHSYDPNRRTKQKSLNEKTTTTGPSVSPGRTPRRLRQTTPQQQFLNGLIRRRQVSLDLLGPNDFFGVPEDLEAGEEAPFVPEDPNDLSHRVIEEEGEDGETTEEPAQKTEKHLFLPLRFAPRDKHVGGTATGGHGHGSNDSGPTRPDPKADPLIQKALERYATAHEQVKEGLLRLSKVIPEEHESDLLVSLTKKVESMNQDLRASLCNEPSTAESTGDDFFDAPAAGDVTADSSTEDDEAGITRAGRSDKGRAAICFFVMLGLTCLVALWDTHLDEEGFILGPVGLACVTDCPGNLETRDFFDGHYHFKKGEVIDLMMNLDANIIGEEHEARPIVEIVGVETGTVKATHEFGPPGEERRSLEHDIVVDFPHPEEAHIININSTDPDVEFSFTLLANVQTPLAEHSVIVAAVIMVIVYAFILLEVIHRTLISIIGSMVALMFFFIMEGGHVESIKIIMLHLEWSTLGLLFGMMLIVGELSHTGVFEWCAVRILILSKGSYVRLLVLLSVLTAVASAFLDNVTTMLLVAPVTIDMCHILGDIDPRPYLIAEVMLSNIGGTATLIGDPPNIIIGSAFSDIISFVDFIIHLMPLIFIFCVPAALVLVVYLYRWYLTSSKMRVLNTAILKKTYRIYDEPRLLISGIVTSFVILMFFLHPVHHKDTAWIALLGAFVTIAFTNPHDIQSALRSHIEWDTLLFFAGLFVLVEVCAAMGLLSAIGDALASYIATQEEDKQLTVAITLLLWVSAFASSFLDNIPYTTTMIPVIQILSDELPDTLPLQTLAWALALGACLGGNGTLLGASANIVTAGISSNKGYEISFLNFLYPGMLVMVLTVAVANLYMLIRYVWV